MGAAGLARVAEDFLPFDVDVTTDFNPDVEALLDGHGIRAAIGGSNSDWLNRSAGGVAYVPSFTIPNTPGGYDTPVFIFPENLGAGNEKYVTDAISHEVGHSLGLHHAGEVIPGQQNPRDYYAGHGPDSPNQTGWGPIMGAAFNKELTQWSKGEYPNAITIVDPLTLDLQDDLAVITSGTFGWWDGEVSATDDGFIREDDSRVPLPDFGDDIASAAELGFTATTFFGEGMIGRDATGGNDVDVFSFRISGNEQVAFNIDQAVVGPNLDILATLYDSSGEVLATSNPHDALNASFSIDLDTSTVTYLDVDGTIVSTIIDGLEPGTFYISIDGTGKVPSSSDAGYSDYGSMGYYTINGVRDKGFLVVGVDFDTEDAFDTDSDLNWNLYSGGGQNDVLTDLVDEAGNDVPYELTISTTGVSVSAAVESTKPIDPADLPDHAVPLDILDGYIAAQNETLTFTWSNLEPWTDYEVFVFGHADFEVHNDVTIIGGNLNGVIQTFSFPQIISGGPSLSHLVVNSAPASNDDLETFAYTVMSDASGQITIKVTNEDGYEAGVGGLAIISTRPITPPEPGSISGQKWNDLDGDKRKDSNEPGLAGWIIYIDENNNGIRDFETTPGGPDVTIPVGVTNLSQSIPDQDPTGVKSTLQVTGTGFISDINVSIDITHTYDGDLRVFLTSPKTLANPEGIRVPLFANVGLNGDNFHNTVFDDRRSNLHHNRQRSFYGHVPSASTAEHLQRSDC